MELLAYASEALHALHPGALFVAGTVLGWFLWG